MKRLVLIGTLLLTACGFEPVYGTHTAARPTIDSLNQVAIDNIPDRKGQMLRNDLIDRMYSKGRPAKPLYHLTVKLNGTLQDLGIQANATSTRSLLDLTATYTLSATNGKDLLSGTAHSISSFNKLSDQYGSLIADESAYERTIKEVSEQIVNRISLFLAEPSQAVTPTTVSPPPVPPANSSALPTASQRLLPMPSPTQQK